MLALVVFGLGGGVGCQDPGPAATPVGVATQATTTQQLEALLNLVVSTAGSPRVQAVKDWIDHTEQVFHMLEDYGRCVETGSDSAGCASQHIVYPGLCYLAAGLLTPVPWLDILDLPLEEACLGEPTLKCCKYTPDEFGCHSAFNTPAPINCEGNPLGGETFGECLRPPNGIGCLCDYIPACDTDGDISPSVVSTDLASAWRFNTLSSKLAAAFPPLLTSSPIEAATFVTFFGCRAHLTAMTTFAPFATQDSIAPGLDVGPAYHTDDDDPDARYLRALMTLAVRRVVTGIPNIIERWNLIMGRTWTTGQITAYLGGADADAVLGAQLGPFGLALLQHAAPTLYPLLAIALPGELPAPRSGVWVAGCAVGAPPDLDVQVSDITGATVTLSLAVIDPVAADNPDGAYVIGLDWGDGRVAGHLFLQGDPTTHVVTHSYAGPGASTIVAVLANTSGLRDTETRVVTIAAGTGDPGVRSIESVELDLLGSVAAQTHGVMWVDVTAIDGADRAHELGRYWIRIQGPSGSRITVDLSQGPLTYLARTDVKALVLRPAHASFSSVSFRELTLGTVTLHHHASEGMAASSAIYQPTNADVVITTTGAAVPVAPLLELATGRLRLPAMNAE
ncbi:MAG: hypothetical protein H7138_10225, partial [Myxococcales bacterium]|nr:hypothetical protein [Myxococcales bacterium]